MQNVSSLSHCMTRLRFVLKDEAKVDKKAVDGIDGVLGSTFGAGQYQVIMGKNLAPAFDALSKNYSFGGGNAVEAETEKKKGIRFISVKEQFDSFTVDGSNESLAIPLQNLINDYYSKDISRKVSAALKVQRENGTYTWHTLPYGYQWNEEKTKIIPYEPYAGYVKDMFRWMIEGIPRNQIKKRLNDSGIPTRQVVGGVAENKRWTITTVTVILRNHVYVGDKVFGKQRNAIYMGIKGERISPDRCPYGQARP